MMLTINNLSMITRIVLLTALINASASYAAAEKAAALPDPAPRASVFRTNVGYGDEFRTIEIDFERAPTPEIVKFFVPYEFRGRNCGGCCPTYGYTRTNLKPAHVQALVRRANINPETTVFRVLKNQTKYAPCDDGFITKADLLAKTLVDPTTGAPECPLDTAANDAVRRRILANFDRSCCAFRCGKKHPATPDAV